MVRTLLITAVCVGLLETSMAAAAEKARLGPTFDCQTVKQPLAQLICASPELSETDLRFGQAYWALLHQVGDSGAKALKAEDVLFIQGVQNECGVPVAGAVPESPQTGACVGYQYEQQRKVWLARLMGAAREEAIRPPAQHLALQEMLQQLGYLSPTSRVDGVYGSAVRQAVTAWQTAADRPATGFLSDADAGLLKRQALERPVTPAQSTIAALPTDQQQIPRGCEAERVPVLIDNERTTVSEVACPNADGNWYYLPAKLPSRRTCADLKITVPVDGKPTDAYGTACTDKDGQWRVIEPVSVSPNAMPAGSGCAELGDGTHKLLVCANEGRVNLVNHYISRKSANQTQ